MPCTMSGHGSYRAPRCVHDIQLQSRDRSGNDAYSYCFFGILTTDPPPVETQCWRTRPGLYSLWTIIEPTR